jgi:molybdate transport system substrate-binding protein
MSTLGRVRRRSLAGLVAGLVAVAAFPARGDEARTLTVAAAANLKPALDQIAAAFRAGHPDADVRITYGASGAFLAQIRNGAPFDLFLSADAEYPAALVENGLADGKAFTYAFGRLAVWTPGGAPLDLAGRGLAALAQSSVKKISMANPAVAPYGRAARAALEKAGVYEAVKDRLVLGQSVGQAAQFAQIGAAQAAILPASLATTPPLSAEGKAWIVPADLHPPLEQAGVVIRGARQAALAREFVAFLSGDGARAVFLRLGYALPAR